MARKPVIYTLPVRHPAHDVSPVSVYTGGQRRWQDIVFSGILIAASLALLAAGATAIGMRLPHSSNPARVAPKTSGLSALGVQRHGALALGSPVSLAWISAPRADRYQLEIAVAGTQRRGSAAAQFRLPILIILTRQPSYAWRAFGTGMYDWRVRASVRGLWGPFSPVRRFVIVPPAIALPIPLLPHNGTRLTHWARLCWSEAQAAAGYYLRVSGSHPIAVTRTCYSLALSPGTYTWRVAAYVQLPRRYAGAYSIPAHFTISAPPSVPRHPATVAARVRPSTIPVVTRATPVTRVVARPTPRASVRPAPSHPVSVPQPVAPPVVQPTTPAKHTTTGCIPLYTC
jgi:hypothetical protein